MPGHSANHVGIIDLRLQRIVELSPSGLHSHGGGYDAYVANKASACEQAERALERLKHERQRQLRELQHQRERLERHQARAGKAAKDGNQAKILLDRQQQRSEATAGRQQRGHEIARQALHAAELGFIHPVSGVAQSFASALPADMAGLLVELRTPS